jgi:spore coat polysaccharide biosynthesis predicted glycosyltransferase SpsG
MDAKLTVGVIRTLKPQAIIIDDYRIGVAWESHVQQWVSHLIVFDDRDEVPHQCSMLIDSRYVGDQTQDRYAGKVNADCIKLLGPQYFLSSADGGKNSEDKALKNSILMSVGGGGDLSLFLEPIRLLLSACDSNQLGSIYLVVGPYAKNEEIFEQYIQDKRLVLIRNCINLMPYIEQSALYIGASGTTLFECLSVGCPALSFSISENQKNIKEHLEDIGHFFHINNFSAMMDKRFASLCLKIFQHKERLKNLLDVNNFCFDTKGAERITLKITSLLTSGVSALSFNDSDIDDQRSISTIAPSVSMRSFRKVVDKDVNRYLEARNLAQNAQNMTVRGEIQEIEHYNWWFENARESFVLENEGLPLLYIWHQLVRVRNGDDYLVGGWFVGVEKVSPIDVMSALKNQLETTATEYPKISWLALIKKNNIFVKKLNEKYGFKKISDEKKIDAIEEIFPNANTDEFDYYEK